LLPFASRWVELGVVSSCCRQSVGKKEGKKIRFVFQKFQNFSLAWFISPRFPQGSVPL
jgi:hypothetical protein